VIIVVGTGLAGASEGMRLHKEHLGESGLQREGVHLPRQLLLPAPGAQHCRAGRHQRRRRTTANDGDSVYRLFYDTIKGGDYRAREANVHRLAEVSHNIIDQCVAQGVPFAREYGGLLDNRSFGGTQVSRTFYARGQTGQQLLLGAYQALMPASGQGHRQDVQPARNARCGAGGRQGCRGIIARNLVTGEVERHGAHAVVLCTGGYGNVFFLSTNAMMCNVTAAWKAHRAAPTSPTRATRRSTPPASRFRRRTRASSR
jgi:succinate dehydrogenase / fumarate reductase flavoprotein subunit